MQYYADKNKRTVVAVMTNTKYDALDYIASRDKALAALTGRHVEQGVVTYDSPEKAPIDLMVGNTYVGVARCADEDEFDLGKGKEIAKRKALLKHHKAVQKKMSLWAAYTYETLNKMLSKSLYRVWHIMEAAGNNAKK